MKVKRQCSQLYGRIFCLLAVWIIFSLTVCPASGANDNFRVIENATIENATKGVIRVFTLSDSYFTPGSVSFAYASGSGFGVGDPGKETDIFITNWHVIYDNDSHKVSDHVYILLNDNAVTRNSEGQYQFSFDDMIPCEVLRTTNGYPDYAILKAERKVPGRVALPLMRSKSAHRGSTVYAIGYPGTADSLREEVMVADTDDSTITQGALASFLQYAKAENTWVIQHKAHINHGNSGGPLLTEQGAVIGINTYGYGEGENIDPNDLEYDLSVFIDYPIKAMDELGIHYVIYTDWIALLWPAFVGAAVLALILSAAVHKRSFVRAAAESAAVSADRIGQADIGKKTPDFSLLRLQGISGDFASRRFPIGARLRLGRDPNQNDLIYPDGNRMISGTHCQLLMENGTLYLQDLNSTNGTWYGGRRLNPNVKVPIHEGDTFELGRNGEVFRIELSGHRT